MERFNNLGDVAIGELDKYDHNTMVVFTWRLLLAVPVL